ncbi:MAG: hypothetical protein AAFV25_05025 [Bacteroidota bacterium]
MNINELEDHFKNVFQDHEAPLDTNEIWDNIKDELEEDRRRKPFFWIFFGLGILLLGGLWWLSNPPVQTAAPAASRTEISTDNAQPITAIHNTSETITDNTSETIATSPPTEEPSTQQGSGDSDNNSVRPPAPPRASNDSRPPSSLLSNTASKAVVAAADPAADQQQRTALGAFDKLPPQIIEQLAVGGPSFGPLPRKKRHPKKSDRSRLKRPLKARWYQSIEGYSGPTLPIRLLNSKFEPGLTDLRKDSESAQLGLSIGTKYQLSNSRGLILNIGIQYDRAEEKLDYRSQTTVKENVRGTTAVIVNRENRVIDSQMGLITRETTTTREKVHHNAYQMINIPVGIGKRFTGRRHDLEWVVGADYNLISFYNGEFRNGTNAFVELGNGNNISDFYYRKKTGWGLWSSVGYNYFVNRKTSLFVRPDVRFPLGSMTTEDYRVNHRHILFSLKIGGRVYL